MDFICYNPSEVSLLTDAENSSGEMDYEDLAIQCGEAQLLVDLDAVLFSEPQPSAIEEVEALTENSENHHP